MTLLPTGDPVLVTWKWHRRDLCEDTEIVRVGVLVGTCVKGNMSALNYRTLLRGARDDKQTRGNSSLLPAHVVCGLRDI